VAIRVKCRNDACGEVFELGDDKIWQRFTCPECGNGLMARPIEFSCSNDACARFLPYNKETSGKRVKCPDCGTVSRAPATLATMAKGPATPRTPAGEGAPPAEKTEKRRTGKLSRRRSRLARARRPSRPFLVTVLVLCVMAAAFAELVLISDRLYPWHERWEPLATVGQFSEAILRASSPLAGNERHAIIAIGATDLLTILFLAGLLLQSNLMRWLSFLICLGGAALSVACSGLLLAAGWAALRALAAAFLLLPATGRWATWRVPERTAE